MSKSAIPMAIGAALAAAATWPAVAQASSPAVCTAGNPSIVVHVAGFKEPAGKVKITLYGPDAHLWLAKGGRISKIDVPVTGRSMDICVPVPAPGRYAVAVHHDLKVNGKRAQRDGGGYSRPLSRSGTAHRASG